VRNRFLTEQINKRAIQNDVNSIDFGNELNAKTQPTESNDKSSGELEGHHRKDSSKAMYLPDQSRQSSSKKSG